MGYSWATGLEPPEPALTQHDHDGACDLADPADRRGTDPDEDDTVISRRGAWREPGIIARD